MCGGGEYGRITQDAMGLGSEHWYLPRFWLCSYYVKTSCNVALLRNVKNLVIISEAHEDTIFRTNFVKKNFPLF